MITHLLQPSRFGRGAARDVAAAVAAGRSADLLPRPTVAGKFFVRLGEKLLLRGVTYGPFPTAEHGERFPAWNRAALDLRAIRRLGANSIRTFTPPPRWLLDLASEHGLGVLAGIDWTQHTCFLESKRSMAESRRMVSRVVADLSGHRAVHAYVIGNEIPPDVVRWFGRERVARFLRSLAADVRAIDPGALVSYANFPTTEYLELDFVDFVSFNVYLHDDPSFRRYVARLQNLAGERPLVLSELGVDAIREGPEAQASMLAWQLRASYEIGAAGTFVFSWSDEWETGGAPVLDWSFGLVDRERRPKPAYDAVRLAYSRPLPPPPPRTPLVSVVICAYNAERTLRACLDSLLALTYRPLEVIVVDDGSTDQTLAIARAYPFRVIHQENRGLSAARNVGIETARGEIVAFTDSDCLVDPDWLTHLVGAMERNGWSAAGGPNLSPSEESRVAACVAVAPGAPAHVLLDDQHAEHVPGCNMAFRRDAILAIGGFDPRYTAAGDDVDVCWRLDDQRLAIGFHPAAVVWHFRRNTLRAYLRQQRGYGHAEGVLFFQHPHRFNPLGQSRWLGRIYGGAISGIAPFGRPRIHYGRFGRGLFQTIYAPPASMFAGIPLTAEWHAVAIGAALAVDAMGGRGLPLALLLFLIPWIASFTLALTVRVEPRHDRASNRLLIALLAWLGPLVRSWERQKTRLAGLARLRPIPAAPGDGDAIRGRGAWWSEHGVGKDTLLEAAIRELRSHDYAVEPDSGWDRWDARLHGLWANARIAVAEENHSGRKRLLRARVRLRPSGFATAAVAGFVIVAFASAGTLGLVVGAPLGGAAAALTLRQGMILRRSIRSALGRGAVALGLLRLPADR